MRHSTLIGQIGNLLFISGQLPIDPESGEIVDGDIKSQTNMALKNLKAVLEPYGVGLENVSKTTIFIKNMNHFPQVNKIYGEYFSDNFPARSCIEVSKLPKDADIEIEAIAFSD